uniref:Large ribosomal subunit protein eL18 n=1 Tax=Ditylenchus dipsaci TaxID=166011 RepID=A0A915D7D1_9BILA
MGIDLCHKYDRKVRRTAPKSEDPYLRVLVKLYRYLANRVEGSNKFNKVVLKRLFMAKRNRPPLSIARLVRNVRKPGNEKKIVVVAGAVTDDKRIYQVPAVTVAALRFTSAARARIIKAGGETITFDQLALRAPKGENTLLIQGPRKSRETRSTLVLLLEFLAAILNRMCALKAESLNVLVVAESPVDTRPKCHHSL